MSAPGNDLEKMTIEENKVWSALWNRIVFNDNINKNDLFDFDEWKSCPLASKTKISKNTMTRLSQFLGESIRDDKPCEWIKIAVVRVLDESDKFEKE